MKLTDQTCKNAKANEKTQKLFDGGGLYLEVTPKGKRYWRLKYRYLGKEKRLAFGVYPDISLKAARALREEAKQHLANSIDPSALKKEAKRQKLVSQENSFREIANEWHSSKKDGWNTKYAKTVLVRLEADIFPEIGDMPVNDISAPQLLSALKKIEARGALDIAKRARQVCGQIFRYAVATGRAQADVTYFLKGALKVGKKSHYSHLDESELPEFFSRLNKYTSEYGGSLLTQLALQFTILTFARTGEVRGALWSEINLEKKEWRIPVERMKMKKLHIVPLSKQVLSLLEQLRKITEPSKYLFPHESNAFKYMSENTMLGALYRMGYHKKATVHGFRAVASTILNEQGFRSDVIERQLAHAERDGVRAAYNHAEYMSERREMMQHWANHIERLANGGSNVIDGKFGTS